MGYLFIVAAGPGAPQPVMPTEDVVMFSMSLYVAPCNNRSICLQDRTPSASSGPGDAKELGAEMAAKDLVTDITNEQDARGVRSNLGLSLLGYSEASNKYPLSIARRKNFWWPGLFASRAGRRFAGRPKQVHAHGT